MVEHESARNGHRMEVQVGATTAEVDNTSRHPRASDITRDTSRFGGVGVCPIPSTSRHHRGPNNAGNTQPYNKTAVGAPNNGHAVTSTTTNPSFRRAPSGRAQDHNHQTAAEIRTADLVKSPTGFGFTLADTSRGQTVSTVTGDRRMTGGLRPADVLLTINGVDVTREPHDSVVSVLKSYQPGSCVRVTFRRPNFSRDAIQYPVRSQSAIAQTPQYSGSSKEQSLHSNGQNTPNHDRIAHHRAIHEDPTRSGDQDRIHDGCTSSSASTPQVDGELSTALTRGRSRKGRNSAKYRQTEGERTTNRDKVADVLATNPVPTSRSNNHDLADRDRLKKESKSHRTENEKEQRGNGDSNNGGSGVKTEKSSHNRLTGLLKRAITPRRSKPVHEIQKQHRMSLNSLNSSLNFSGTPDFIPASHYGSRLSSSSGALGQGDLSTRPPHRRSGREQKYREEAGRTAAAHPAAATDDKTMAFDAKRPALSEAGNKRCHSAMTVSTVPGHPNSETDVGERITTQLAITSFDGRGPYAGDISRSQTGRNEADAASELNGHDQQRCAAAAPPPLQSSLQSVYSVDIHRGSRGFGFSIRGGKEFNGMPLLVLNIADGGPAHMDGRLQNGDEMLSINGVSTRDMTHERAIQLIQNTCSPISLVMKRHETARVSETIIKHQKY